LDILDLKILIKRAWMLAVAAMIGGFLAFVVSQFRPTIYEAHARLMVGPGIESPNPDLNVLRAGGQLIQMYAEMPLTEPFLINVIRDLKVDMTPEDLVQWIEMRPNQETQILTVQVEHPDPEMAVRIAASVAQQLVNVSPSNPMSAAALIKDQMRAQIIELEATVAEIKERIPVLQANYEEAVEEERASREEAGSIQYIAEQLEQFEENELSGNASTQREAGVAILQELVINTNARILKFERMLREDSNTTTQKLIIDQIRLERNHLSKLQQAIAEIERPVEGLPLDEYIAVTQEKIADLESEMTRLNFDFQRLQLDRISREQQKLDQARLIESNRQKLILEQIAEERERISQVELASIEKQRLILEQIATERARLTDTQNTLALLYNSLREADPNQVRIIELPSKAVPLATSTGLAMLLGAFAAAGLVAVVVLVLDKMDDGIRTGEQVSAVLPVPVIDLDGRGKGILGVLHPAELPRRTYQKYQMLGIHLLYGEKGGPTRLVVVSATDAGSSAGTVAADLAVALAQSGKSVILVDLDGAEPAISAMFGLHNAEGVSDFLMGEAPSPNSLVSVDGLPALVVWPFGKQRIDPAQVNSPRMAQALDTFGKQADIVLCAAPPVHRPDTLLLASRVDGAVLVVSKGRTTVKALQDIAENMRLVDAKPLAAVLRAGSDASASEWLDWRRGAQEMRHGYQVTRTQVERLSNQPAAPDAETVKTTAVFK